MSARMQVPLSQRRHTNVAAVRYMKNGHKLEIACYKNKVISYRNGVETRLDEVLQIDRVFTNISRGLFASEKDIQAVFGKGTTEADALKYILVHGELQVAQHEREVEVNQMFTDIALIISQKCLNEVTQRPFPAQVIEQALRSIGAAVKVDQPAKKQALALIHKLIEAQIIPIARAPMKLRCTVPDELSVKTVTEWCEVNKATLLDEHEPGDADNGGAGRHSVLLLLQPHLFRDLESFVREKMPRGATVHMVDSVAMDAGEVGVMDTNLIARANAHAFVADGAEANGGVSQQAGSGSSLAQGSSSKRGKKGERSCRKHKNAKYLTQKDENPPQKGNEQEGGSALHTADLSSTGTGTDGGTDDFDMRVALSKLGLDGLRAREGGIDDDDEKSRRGKKKAKRRQVAQQQQPKPKKEVKMDALEESDEEILANRKQRKMAAAKGRDSGNNDDGESNDEHNYDYDEEVEEG